MTANADAVAELDARDLRRGGRWTRPQAFKNALIRTTIRVALTVADRSPRRVLSFACACVGTLLWGASRSLRRAAELAIADAMPSLARVDARRLARRCFAEAGRSLATILLLRRPAIRALDLIDVPDAARETLSAALSSGNGVVFVSAHLGPFEVVAAAIAELGHSPVAVVRESYDPALDAIVDQHRIARGVGVIHRGDPGSAFGIVRALRRGHPVGFLPDLGARVPGIPLSFLGRTLSMPIGPQQIAARTRTELLVGTLAPPVRGGWRPRLALEAIGGTDDEILLTHRVVTALERRVRAFPGQWLWMAQRHP